MVKKLLVLGIAIAMCLGIFAGCAEKDFVVGYYELGGFGYFEPGENGTASKRVFCPATIVDSVEQLEDLCVEYRVHAFQEDSENYSRELYKKIRSYDNEFFAEKVMVIYNEFSSDPDKGNRIDKVTVENGVLIISAYRVQKVRFGCGLDARGAVNALMLIEINKSLAEGATSVQVKYE